jgi:hypothetical protein
VPGHNIAQVQAQMEAYGPGQKGLRVGIPTTISINSHRCSWGR